MLDCFDSTERFTNADLKRYDAVFLDVCIGQTNGLAAAQALRRQNSSALLVFVSSFMEYAHLGYEVNAFRYLLKGDLAQTLDSCMRDVLKKLQTRAKNFHFKTTEGAAETLLVSDIWFFESLNHNMLIHTSKKVYQVYGVLTDIEAHIGCADFLRIQRSYLVNMRNVDTVKGCEAKMPDGKTLVCSRQKAKEMHRLYLLVQGEC